MPAPGSGGGPDRSGDLSGYGRHRGSECRGKKVEGRWALESKAGRME